MPYGKQIWKDGAADTPLSAARLTHMEDGISTAYDAAEQALDQVSGRLSEEALSSTFGGVINVHAFGAVGDGVADDHPAIRAALEHAATFSLGGLVYAPPGIYRLSDELRIPSRVTLYGAGMDATLIVLAEGVDKNKCVITNAGNTRVAHSTPDVGIRIRDLTVDGNADGVKREDVTVSAPWGSAITLACVEDSSIERVRAVRGNLHCIDISASVYLNPSPNLAYAEGPSRNVKIIDCIAEDSRGDDAFTTHYSEYVEFRGCTARRTIPLRVHNQIGFEIDEGSRQVTLSDCVAFGWNVGFQAKGHGSGTTAVPAFAGSVPASSIDFIRCVADGCNYGFEMGWESADNASVDIMAENISLVGCVSRGNVAAWTGGGDPRAGLYSLWINKYQNVTVRDFRVEDTAGGGVVVQGYARNVLLDGITFRNACTSIPAAALYQAFVSLGSAARDVEVNDVTVANWDALYPVIRTATVNALIDTVRVRYTSSPDIPAVSADNSTKLRWVRNVFAEGSNAPIRIDGGDYPGDYGSHWERGIDAMTGPWKTVALPESWGGTIRYARRGNQVTLRVDAVTPPAGTALGVHTLGTLLAGHRPSSIVAGFAVKYTTPPTDSSGTMWINSAGTVRVNCQAGDTIHGSTVYPVPA